MNTNFKRHFFLIIPAAALLLLIFTNVDSVNAQIGVPPGSYKDSCKDIQVMPGSTLWAQCKKANGDYQKSSLRFANCEGDISNNNGKLSCKQKAGKQPPNGSYKNSCKNIRVEGKQLKAKCEKKNGKWNSTSIKYKNCSGDIRNNNGELRCNGGGGSKIPNGSYRNSCKNSYVEGNRLYSNCKKKNGSWHKSSINYNNCNKDIKNDNGKLTCGGGNNSKYPKGSYKKSCKNLYKESGRLEADCKKDNGKWKHSSIRFKKCSNGIWNDNGKLRCN